MPSEETAQFEGAVCCPICTHRVKARVRSVRVRLDDKMVVISGQKCSRCFTSLDAAFIVEVSNGATSVAVPLQSDSGPVAA